jgi:hypothetical protein
MDFARLLPDDAAFTLGVVARGRCGSRASGAEAVFGRCAALAQYLHLADPEQIELLALVCPRATTRLRRGGLSRLPAAAILLGEW